MWAVFERPGDRPFSRLLSIETEAEIARSHPALQAAFLLHGFSWAPRPEGEIRPPWHQSPF